MRPKVFVVEGRNDASRLRSIFQDIAVITTNGSAINPEAVEALKTLDQTHDIVLFLDPDHAGERIRRLLTKELRHCYHAFIDKEVAFSKNKRKIGIEHASEADIKEALKDIKMVHQQSQSDVTHAFLYAYGLTGHKDSREKREKLSKVLRIGYVNGKTLYHRLHMFQIMEKDIIEVFE
jgi:ribonuclease M5